MNDIKNDAHTHFHMPAHIIRTTVEDSTILLNIESNIFYTLNTVANRVFILLVDAYLTLEEAVLQIQQEFDVEESKLRADVEELLAHFLTLQLLE